MWQMDINGDAVGRKGTHVYALWRFFGRALATATVYSCSYVHTEFRR